MPTATYVQRRGELHTYFDRTAVEAWKRLTSDAPVGRIRATVRAGRETMRSTLLDWLPADLSGKRILDAGCGVGTLALECARRGAMVVGTDLSPTLVGLARDSAEAAGLGHRIDYRVGDMLDAELGRFDHVVCMDSLIHYRVEDVARALAGFAARTDGSVLFTFAPRTTLLATMHAVGRFFPRGNRAPAIEPTTMSELARAVAAEPGLAGWRRERSLRISRGFYISQAVEFAAP